MGSTMGGGDVNDCSSGMEQKTLKESFELCTSWSSSEKEKKQESTNQYRNLRADFDIGSLTLVWL
jgi:hypothetical protein